MRMLFLIIAFYSLNFAALSQTKTMSLEQATQQALETSYDVKFALLEKLKAEKDLKATIAIGLPQISASTSYQNFIEQPIQLIPAEFFGGQSGSFAEVSFVTDQQVTAEVKGTQLIFSGSYIVGLQAARNYLQFKDLEIEQTKSSVRVATKNAYYNVLALESTLETLESNATNLQKIVDETKTLYEEGFVEEQNAEQLELSYNGLRNTTENTRAQLDMARKMLNVQMGLPLNSNIVLSDEFKTLVDQSAQLQDTSSFSVDQNIDYQLLQSGLELQKLNLKNKQAEYLPIISGFISQQTNAFSNSFTFLDEQRFFPSSVWGLRINVPIFSSFQKHNNVEKARIDVEKITLQQAQLGDVLQSRYDNALSIYNNSLKSYLNSKQSLELSQKIKDKTYIKYQEGLITSFELTQIDNQHLAGEAKYISTMLTLLKAKAELDNIRNIE